MSEKNQNVFLSLNPKANFFLGLIASVLVISTIGFFVLLAKGFNDDKSEIKNTVKTNSNNVVAQAPAPAPTAGAKIDFQISANDHVRGNRNAPVQIVEFSDVQCPYCSRFQPTMNQVMEEYGDQVVWAYKHFPLDQLHPNARPGAEASECIAEQAGDEGFFTFLDGLFANQSSLGTALYQQLAGEIGVNLNQFNNCVASRKYQQKVEADYQEGAKAGVTGTPGSFINGNLVKGAVPYESLKQIIDSELSK